MYGQVMFSTIIPKLHKMCASQICSCGLSFLRRYLKSNYNFQRNFHNHFLSDLSHLWRQVN